MYPTASLRTLGNGARMVTAPIRTSETMTIMVGVKAGARSEKKDERGISHLVEHQVLKGSDAYATPTAMNKALSSVGAFYNASTNMEWTTFGLTCPRENGMRALEILSDLVLRSSIPQGEFEREKFIVAEEHRLHKNADDAYVEAVFEDLMYESQQLGQSIDGTLTTLRNIDRKAVLRYIRKWYVGNRMAVVVAGGGDVEGVSHHAARIFGKVPTGTDQDWKPFVRTGKGSRSRHFHRNDEMTTVCFGVPAVPFESEYMIPIELACEVYGGAGTSSRLYDLLRERMGLVYDVYAQMQFYSDAGHMAVKTSTSKNNAEMVVRVLQEEYDRLLTTRITKEELKIAKAMVRSRLAMLPERQEELARHYVINLLGWNSLVQLADLDRSLRDVSLDAVQDAVQQVFVGAPRYLVTIGGAEAPRP